MFMFKVFVYLKELEKFNLVIVSNVKKLVNESKIDFDFVCLG